MTKNSTSEKSSHPVFLCHVFCSFISFPKCFQVMNLLWQTQQSVVIHLFTERCFSWFTLKPLELGTWRVPFIACRTKQVRDSKTETGAIFQKKKKGGEGGGFLRNPEKNGRIMFTVKLHLWQLQFVHLRSCKFKYDCFLTWTLLYLWLRFAVAAKTTCNK